MAASAPRSPEAHLLESALGHHIFVADGSRLFDADPQFFEQFDAAMATGGAATLLEHAGLGGTAMIDDTPFEPRPIHALSLAVAQKCNLGCTYCYAQQGDFGGPAKKIGRAHV